MKKAFIFDMDGLLINSEPLWRQAGLEVLPQYGLPVTMQDFVGWTGTPVPTLVEKAVRRYGVEVDVVDVSEHFIHRAIDLILKTKPLMPGVKETLALLKQHNIKMGIASASPRKLLENIVTSCGIADYFSVISSAAELHYNKPHPEVYLHALRQLGVSPMDAVGLEDSRVGMISVKAANMTAIVIPSEEDRPQAYWALADYQLTSLLEINEDFLARL